MTSTTLEVIYENWREYHTKLRAALAPLTDEHLLLQPAPHLWSLGRILRHMIETRAWWINTFLKENDSSVTEYAEWDIPDAPPRTIAEILRGMDATWTFIEARLQRWTQEDCAVTFPDEVDGEIRQVSRSWVIYHVLEHDLHHGGEVSLILGMNNLQAPDV